MKTFVSVTETPGMTVDRQKLQVICRRYHFAAEFVSGMDVLEVACGPGLGLGYLAKKAKKIIAGDCTEESLRWAQETYEGRENIGLLLFDAHQLPFQDCCFDVIVVVASTCYLYLDRFLDECHRILKKGGILVLDMPNKDLPGFSPSLLSTKYYSVPELFTLLNSHHFTLEIFGGFPTGEGLAKPRKTLIAAGKIVINFFAFVPKLRELLRRLGLKVIGYKTFTLGKELDDQHMEMVKTIPLVPLDRNSPNLKYRVLYGIARRC